MSPMKVKKMEKMEITMMKVMLRSNQPPTSLTFLKLRTCQDK